MKGENIMLEIFRTDLETNKTEIVTKYEKGNWINMISPSEDEIMDVCKNLKINEDFIRYALDYEEKARIDVEEDDNTILFIIDVPIREREGDSLIYTTMPIIQDLKKNDMRNIITYKKSRFLLQILYSNASMYLNLLKKINKETEIAESILKNSMKNRALLKLLNLEKSLVYFTTSLKSNEVVMEKTMRGKIIKLYEEDEDILEDSIIENKQAIEMAKIYSDILNGTMDAYASIISNNLNRVMKFLTSITIILSIPTMIASFWGMNVPVPMQNNPYGFIILIGFSVIISVIATVWLNKRDMLK